MTSMATERRTESSPDSARVLVVDDHDDMRAMLREMLRSRGHVVRTAGSVEEALAALEEERFDLVLTDFAMPGRDGLALVRALSEDPRWRSTRVVVMSGNGGPELLSGLGPHGAIVFLRKPFSFEHVLLLVRRARAARDEVDPRRGGGTGNNNGGGGADREGRPAER